MNNRMSMLALAITSKTKLSLAENEKKNNNLINSIKI